MPERLNEQALDDVLKRVQKRLAERAAEVETVTEEGVKRIISSCVNEVMSAMFGKPHPSDVMYVTKLVERDFLQYGAIQPMLDDDDVTEIMVNSYDKVFVEINGRIERVSGQVFEDEAEVKRLIDKIASQLNKHCDAQTPYMDARLKDGSRVNAIVEELRGEKIDIIDWSDDPEVLIKHALSPALVDSVTVNEEEKTAKVVVPEEHVMQFEIGGRSLLKKIRRITGWVNDEPRVCNGEYLPMHHAIRFDLMKAMPTVIPS